MSRTSKNNKPVDLQAVAEPQGEQESQQPNETGQSDEVGQTEKPVEDKEQDEVEVPPYVAELMRLYPQYDEFWITPRGFLHPKGMPTHLLKDAVLYKNKFFNK